MSHGALINQAASLGARAVLLRQRAAMMPAGPERDAAVEAAGHARQEADDAWAAARAATERRLVGGEPAPPISWETPSAFVATHATVGGIVRAVCVKLLERRDAALLDALQACMVPGNDYGTVENLRGVMAALRGERR